MNNTYKLWCNENIQHLIQNYNKTKNSELAIKLNRTENAIGHKLYKLGLNREFKLISCLICGKLKTRRNQKYCSLRCYGISRRGICPSNVFKMGHKINNGKIPWNKGLTKELDKRIKGGGPCKNPILKSKKISEKAKERLKDKTKHPQYGKTCFRLKKLNKDPEFIKKRLKGLIKSPNKPEQKLINIINRNNLPYKYVGNGEIIIGFKNPDFLNINGEKKIIEVFGDYWHNNYKTKWHQTEEGCKKYYSKYGLSTLVIWEHELDDENKIINKISKWGD
jgi:hypothetical protein